MVFDPVSAAVLFAGAAASITNAANNVTNVVEAFQSIKGRQEEKGRPTEDIIESLCDDLTVISGFMKDLQWIRWKSDTMTAIENLIGNIVLDGEDAISMYRVYIQRCKQGLWTNKKLKSKLIMVRKKAEHVENSISNALTTFDVMSKRLSTNISGETNLAAKKAAETEEKLQKPRMDVEKNVVGFVEDFKVLFNQLTTGDLERQVISITGMGGAGKTTLAKKLYNDDDIISHFHPCAWIDLEGKSPYLNLLSQIVLRLVMDPFSKNLKDAGGSGDSDLYGARSVWKYFYDLIKPIIRSSSSTDAALNDIKVSKFSSDNLQNTEKRISQELRDMDDNTLKEILTRHLKGKRYLIVLDDLWDNETWNTLKDALPADNINGSRILITTRINTVARHANSSPHSIRRLDATESMVLFCKHLFGVEKFEEGANWEGICKNLFQEHKGSHSQVEKLAPELARACQGLPLSIVQLADHLTGTQKTHATWSKISDVNSYLAENKPQCLDILALSYHHLPLHLKQCLLYLAAFPKNKEIPVRQLVQFWIAEEFINDDHDKIMEDTAEDYLDQLIDESLIQPLTWRLDGGVKRCIVHGLVQELCKSEIENMFLEVHRDAKLPSISSKPWILSLQGNASGFMPSECHGLSSVRSLLCFREGALSILESQLKDLFQKIELIQVLNLGDVELKSIPDAIGELNQLRYLKVKGAKLKAIPDSIHNLSKLLTVDLRGSAVNNLPKGIWKLKLLRHLYLSEPTKLPDFSSPEHNTLNDLQVLSCLFLNEHSVNLIASRRSFPFIRKLRVCGRHRSVNGKSHKIQAKIWQKVSFSLLTHLTKITLVDVTMDSGLIVALGSLPELLILKISAGQSSNDLNALLVTKGFHKLRVLQMAHFPIESFILNWNAMEGLQRLIIKECSNLNMLPLQGLNNLEEVHVQGCSPELTAKLEQMRRASCPFKITIHPPRGTA